MSAQPDDGVRRLPDARALRTLAGDDVYVRTSLGGDCSAWWAGPGSALGWVVPGRRFPGRGHLVVTGDAADAAALASRVMTDTEVTSMSLPRDVDRLVRPAVRLHPRNDWEWMYADAAPPVQAREDEVGWLDDGDDGDILALLTTWSGRHDTVPGDEGVLGWAGVRAGGRLVAAAAHLEHHPGVPYLASIATSGEARGQGLGAAVTAWLTRQLLVPGRELVTLGMYSDNAVARRMYLRLGYRIDKRWTSGRLVPPG